MNNIDKIVKLASNFEKNSYFSMVKLAIVKKMPNGKYRVVSKKGKNLGEYDSKSGAEERLRQVEYFKHRDAGAVEDEPKSEKEIDLTKASEFCYSAISREMRKKASKEQFIEFLKLYKKFFDKATKNKIQRPEKVALQNSLFAFNKLHKIKVNKKLVKSAQVISELGDPYQVGRYLSDIVKFTLAKMPIKKRQEAIAKLRIKLFALNENELSGKHMNNFAAMGQAISFVKTILFNHSPSYIRIVLNNLVRNL